MTTNGFIRRYYRYLNRDIPIPDFEKIDIYNYDFSKHFENVPSEIDISKIEPTRLVEKLSTEKRISEDRWGSIEGDTLNIRQFVQMENLSTSDYDWDKFDNMAYRYQYFLRKKLNNCLSYPEAFEMDNLVHLKVKTYRFHCMRFLS